MHVEVSCPACRVAHKFPAFVRGKRVRCKQCKKPFLVDPMTDLKEDGPQSAAAPPPTPPGANRPTLPLSPETKPTVKVTGPKKPPEKEKVFVGEVLDEVSEVEEPPPLDAVADEEEVAAELVDEPPQSFRAATSGPPSARRRVEPLQPPRRFDGEDEEDEEEDEELPSETPKRSPLLLIVGGLVAAVLLVGVLGCAGVLLYSFSGTGNPVVQATTPENPGVPPGGQPPPNGGEQRPPQVEEQPPVRPLEGPVGWTVTVDPPAEPVPLPADMQPLAIPVGEDVVFPTTPSPFVALGQNLVPSDTREVWNLQTGRLTATLRGVVHLTDPLILSPDGVYLAGASRLGTGTEVWSFTTGKRVQRLPNVGLIDFAGPGQVVTVHNAAAGKEFQVWDLADRQAVRNIQGPGLYDDNSPAVSPGRRFLAVASLGRLLVYDLVSGKPVGEKMLPRADEGDLRCEGLAFSPDGAELAGLFQAGSKLRVLSVDLVRETVVNHALPDVPNPPVAGRRPRPLEWLPDRSGWLIRGALYVSAQNGARDWVEFPATITNAGARHVLDSNHLLVVAGKPTERMLQSVAVTHKGTGPGGAGPTPVLVAPASKQPAPKDADWSKVKTLTGSAPASWSAKPDPAAAGKEGLAPCKLQTSGEEVQRILFARPDVARAAVLSVVHGAEGSAQRARLDLYDLAGSKSLGSIEDIAHVPGGENGLPVADLSGDGTVLALRDPRDARRVDVWSPAAGDHVAAWLPYEKEGTTSNTITWLGFVDAQRLLTNNSAGQLVLWDVAACQAVWRLENVSKGAVAFSPGRNTLAVYNGETCELLNATTGERKGQGVKPKGIDLTQCTALAFSADGSELAGLLQPAGVRTDPPILMRWDVKTGNVLLEGPVIRTSPQLDWCGPRHLLIGGEYLLDLERKAFVWRYHLPAPGKHATGSPDGRHWFTRSAMPQEPAALTAQKVPQAAVTTRVTQMFSPATKSLLKPGTPVDVVVEVKGVFFTEEKGRHDQLQVDLVQRLGGVGLVPQGNAGMVLKLVVNEQDADRVEVEQRSNFLGDRIERKSVALKTLVCELGFIDARTKVLLWKGSNVFSASRPDRIFEPRDDPEAVLKKELWERLYTWIRQDLTIPNQIGRSGNDVISLPGDSTLQGDP